METYVTNSSVNVTESKIIDICLCKIKNRSYKGNFAIFGAIIVCQTATYDSIRLIRSQLNKYE